MISVDSILVCMDSHNKVPQTGGLRQQKFAYSQFWRLEVQEQDAGRVSSSEATLLGLQMPSSPWVITGSSFCVCLCPNVLLLLGHQSYWIRAHFGDLILT